MANKPRLKMPVSERAKQFMPFSALKGLDEALRQKEKVLVEKKELSEEVSEEISYILNDIKKGDFVKVVFFHEGEYLSAEGVVSFFDATEKRMTIVKNDIEFENIYRIKKRGNLL